MTEVAITVDCQFSGQTADFDYDDTNTLAQLIHDLQEQAMAWPRHSADGGLVLDGVDGGYHLHQGPPHPFDISWPGNQTLAEIGVESGSIILIQAPFPGCGPALRPIVFLNAGEVINNPSPNWYKELGWTAGDHEPIEDLICRSVLPKDVNYSSVYVTLHAHDKNGQISTLFRNRCLEEIAGKTQIMFEADVQHMVYGWLCFLSSKPRKAPPPPPRRRLGE